jgi:hypothetical protein
MQNTVRTAQLTRQKVILPFAHLYHLTPAIITALWADSVRTLGIATIVAYDKRNRLKLIVLAATPTATL